MLVYNTTYQVGIDEARNFVIWISECYIPKVQESGQLLNPRLLQILSHKDQQTECFSLQWEVENSAILHQWHTQQGAALAQEMVKLFNEQVVAFTTLMEVIK